MSDKGSLSEAPEEEPLEFEYEGFFTHYVCPECGFNDWVEGDARGQDAECEGCGFKGRIPS